MKPKTIRIIIRKKLERWWESIQDQELREHLKENTLVTGGAIASMLLGETVNDYDLYFRTKDTASRVANYYVRKFLENPPPRFKNSGKEVKIFVKTTEDRVKIVVQSAGIAGESAVETIMQGSAGYEYFEGNPDDDAGEKYVDGVVQATTDQVAADKPPYRPIFLSSNAITLSDGIQLVIRFWGTPEEIHKNYDYVHCTCSYDSATRHLNLPNDALTAMLSKELRYIGSKYPICSLIRMRKFLQREWRITAGQIVKMCWDVSGLDLTDINVLEEQLVGVDAAYFAEILAILKQDKAEGKIKDIDRAYIMSVIDRVF